MVILLKESGSFRKSYTKKWTLSHKISRFFVRFNDRNQITFKDVVKLSLLQKYSSFSVAFLAKLRVPKMDRTRKRFLKRDGGSDTSAGQFGTDELNDTDRTQSRKSQVLDAARLLNDQWPSP